MPELMGNARQLLSMCVAAAGGQLDDAQQGALATQVIGAFAVMPVVGRNIVLMANRRDWNGLVGAIGSYIDVQEASSPGFRVSATSTASAVAVSHQDFIGAIRAIERADEMADSDKERLEELLTEVESAALERNSKTFATKVAEWLALAADSATVVTTCAPFLANLFATLAQ